MIWNHVLIGSDDIIVSMERRVYDSNVYRKNLYLKLSVTVIVKVHYMCSGTDVW